MEGIHRNPLHDIEWIEEIPAPGNAVEDHCFRVDESISMVGLIGWRKKYMRPWKAEEMLHLALQLMRFARLPRQLGSIYVDSGYHAGGEPHGVNPGAVPHLDLSALSLLPAAHENGTEL